MQKQEIKRILEKVRKEAPKKKFTQSIDYIVSFKDLDLKKTENQVEFFVVLNHGTGKESRICSLVGPELIENAKVSSDTAILVDDFDKVAKDKKLIKGLADKHAFFIAQAAIMPKVASAFGRVLGPKGKMPNPKAGCVVPQNINLRPVVEKLKKTVKVSIKKGPFFMARVGAESSNDEEIVDNVFTLYNAILHHLPKEKHNIKSQYLKTTMGKPVHFESQDAVKQNEKDS